jgi:hypothetical protein
VITKTSKRRTSKIALAVNTVLAWGLAFYGVGTGQGAAVVAGCLALIGSLYGAYVGVGHFDFKRALETFTNIQGTAADAVGTQELEISDPDDEPFGFVRHGDRAVPEG